MNIITKDKEKNTNKKPKQSITTKRIKRIIFVMKWYIEKNAWRCFFVFFFDSLLSNFGLCSMSSWKLIIFILIFTCSVSLAPDSNILRQWKRWKLTCCEIKLMVVVAVSCIGIFFLPRNNIGIYIWIWAKCVSACGQMVCFVFFHVFLCVNDVADVVILIIIIVVTVAKIMWKFKKKWQVFLVNEELAFLNAN